MATRRKKATTNTRRKPTQAANPRKRRSNRTTIYAAGPQRNRGNRRTFNPRRRTRRRNPQVKTLVVGSLFAAAGAMTQGIIAGFVPIKAQGLMGIGIELGVAYVTAMVGEKVIGGQNAQFFAVGAAAGVGKSILNYVFGLAQSGVGALTSATAAPPQLPGPPPPQVGDVMYYDGPFGMNGYGVGDVVETPEYWPSV